MSAAELKQQQDTNKLQMPDVPATTVDKGQVGLMDVNQGGNQRVEGMNDSEAKQGKEEQPLQKALPIPAKQGSSTTTKHEQSAQEQEKDREVQNSQKQDDAKHSPANDVEMQSSEKAVEEPTADTTKKASPAKQDKGKPLQESEKNDQDVEMEAPENEAEKPPVQEKQIEKTLAGQNACKSNQEEQIEETKVEEDNAE